MSDTHFSCVPTPGGAQRNFNDKSSPRVPSLPQHNWDGKTRGQGGGASGSPLVERTARPLRTWDPSQHPPHHHHFPLWGQNWVQSWGQATWEARWGRASPDWVREGGKVHPRVHSARANQDRRLPAWGGGGICFRAARVPWPGLETASPRGPSAPSGPGSEEDVRQGETPGGWD